ncbi:MAG: 2-hydroxyacid dehydrogenase [Myxococcaceae bacterium]
MTKPRVFVSRALVGDALERLRAVAEVRVFEEPRPPTRDELLAGIRDADGLLCMLTDRIDATLLDAAPGLKVVSNHAVGVDNIDLAACTARGIPVGNTPGVLTDATADFTLALLLAASRRVVEADRFVRAGQWKHWDPALLLGRDLAGATLGIAGMGAIGKAVARRARGFSLRLLYASRSSHPGIEAETGAKRVDKDTLLAESDFLSLHVALTPETRHYLGAGELSRMKPGSVLVNTTRGPVVDQAALVEALRAGRPAMAALDVMEREPIPPGDPLLSLPNVVLAPHLGSATVETRAKMASLAVENLVAVLLGQRPRHCANPEVFGR